MWPRSRLRASSSDKSKIYGSFSYGSHRRCFAGRCLVGAARDRSGRDPRLQVRKLNRYSLVENNTTILLALRTRRIEAMILSHSRRFQGLPEKSRRSIKAGKSVSHDKFRDVMRIARNHDLGNTRCSPSH
jgi:hypothetical protein